MNPDALLARMSSFPEVLHALVTPLSAADARWRPESGGWSVLEIVAHLKDEEIQDFRPRLAATLADPDRAWDPIDPAGDVERLRYNDFDIANACHTFRTRRAESLVWLRGLDRPDWTRAHHHPRGHVISAADLLVSWAAHDALHLRQLARRLFDLAQRDLPEANTLYAGEW